MKLFFLPKELSFSLSGEAVSELIKLFSCQFFASRNETNLIKLELFFLALNFSRTQNDETEIISLFCNDFWHFLCCSIISFTNIKT